MNKDEQRKKLIEYMQSDEHRDEVLAEQNSPRPVLECLQAIAIGLSIPLFFAIIIRLISEL